MIMSKIKGMFASFFQKEKPSYTPSRIDYIIDAGRKMLAEGEKEEREEGS